MGWVRFLAGRERGYCGDPHKIIHSVTVTFDRRI